MTVHVVVPSTIDDSAHPSGGNRYDRRVCDSLRAAGVDVHEHPSAGDWPTPDPPDKDDLGRVVADIPDGACLLVDGLIASAVPEVLVPHARRLTLVVLVHLPLGFGPQDDDLTSVRTREGDVLAAASGIIVTSSWTRTWLLDTYALDMHRIHVAPPGADWAEVAPGTRDGGALLCVAAVVPNKAHDILLAALADLAAPAAPAASADLPLPSWQLTLVGSLDRDRVFVDGVRRQAAMSRLVDRIDFPGPLLPADVDRAYAAADLVVLPSYIETYGMVVTEALSHGLPVLATDVGGVAEALGKTPAARRPGMLVAPGDAAALSAALRRWLTDADMRHELRAAARQRRETLTSWTTTGDLVAGALADAAAHARADQTRLVMADGPSR